MDGSRGTEIPQNIKPIRPDVVAGPPAEGRGVMGRINSTLFTPPSDPQKDREHADQIRQGIRAHAGIELQTSSETTLDQGFKELREEFETNRNARQQQLDAAMKRLDERSKKPLLGRIVSSVADMGVTTSEIRRGKADIAELDGRLKMVGDRDAKGATKFITDEIDLYIPLAHGKSVITSNDGDKRRDYRSQALRRIVLLGKFDAEKAREYLERLDSSSGNKAVDLGLA